MQCDKCGGSTRVTNSRTPVSAKKSLTGSIVRAVRQAVEWYTSEWVMRTRICLTCSRHVTTVEVSLADFEAMMKEKEAS